MTHQEENSTALVLSTPKTGLGHRLLSRITLGQVLLGTLCVGALSGLGLGAALSDSTTERVIPPVIVTHHTFETVEPVERSLPRVSPYETQCHFGAFLGIEFRRDQSYNDWLRTKESYRRGVDFADLDRIAGKTGVHILSVVHGSAAESMGLRPGDVIVEMDGKAIRSTAQLASEIESRCVGEITTLRIHRGVQSRLLSGDLRRRNIGGCRR